MMMQGEHDAAMTGFVIGASRSGCRFADGMMKAFGAALLALALARPAAAQTPVSRDDAVAAALRRGARLLLARADSAAAFAARRTARAFPNPDVTAQYSKDAPQHHVEIGLPLDLPWLRSPRVGSADASAAAASYRYAAERAAIRFEAESAYLAAQAAAAHARLSRRTALDADSLAALTRLRRDAGDASQLDVELAAVNAGDLANQALDDSLQAVAGVLDLQLLMGLGADSIRIALTDSLARPAPGATDSAPTGVALPVAAAAASLRAAEQDVKLQRGSVLGVPSLMLGIEQGAPDEPGLLPTFGITFELPLFNQHGGAIAGAMAERDRAAAELAQTTRETDAAVARARRERDAALARVDRDARLLAAAERVASMSLVAYREGAAALPNVLEAARSAREALGRYVDDLAAAGTADAQLRYLTTTTEP